MPIKENAADFVETIIYSCPVAVVKLSACWPSTPTIRVRVPPKSTI